MGSQTLPDSGETVQTDASGRFTIKRAHPGSATVRVSPDSDNTLWLPATITGPTLDDLVVNPTPPPEYDYPDEGED